MTRELRIIAHKSSALLHNAFLGNAHYLLCMSEPGLQDKQRREIQRIMKECGWSGNQLAKSAGVAPSTINRFLNGDSVKHALSARTMEKIRNAANLSQNNSFDAIVSREVRIYVLGSVQAGEPANITETPLNPRS